MSLKKLINKSYYGTIGYISSEEDLLVLEGYIKYNYDILKQYKGIIVATNYKTYPKYSTQNKELWTKYFPNCVILDQEINRGHNFGTADLDNLLFNYCKTNNIEWLCKSAHDMIFHPPLLDKQVSEADFYYLDGIGMGGVRHYNNDFNLIKKDYFYPQTNFYFINVAKTDYLTDQEYLDDTYEYVSELHNYNGKIWEYIQGWTCEDFLKNCVDRNKLTKQNLVSEDVFTKLLEFIVERHVDDPSHKNIMIESICHLQDHTYPIRIISE